MASAFENEEITKLRALVGELADALIRYGKHDKDCVRSGIGGSCICGLSETRAGLRIRAEEEATK